MAKKKILIIDDALDVCEVLATRLRSLNFDCTWTFSAVEALQNIEETGPDLIVLDMDLPVMSGFGFLHELREHPGFMRTPVVVFSGIKDKIVQKEALSSGAKAYLTKPCSFSRMMDAICANI